MSNVEAVLKKLYSTPHLPTANSPLLYQA